MPKRGFELLVLVIVASLGVGTFGAGSAAASRKATRAEAKAIKKAFLKGRSKATKVRRIRVSTVNSRFALVSYTANVSAPQSIGARAAKVYKPTPVILKKGKGAKWKPVSKAPAKKRRT